MIPNFFSSNSPVFLFKTMQIFDNKSEIKQQHLTSLTNTSKKSRKSHSAPTVNTQVRLPQMKNDSFCVLVSVCSSHTFRARIWIMLWLIATYTFQMGRVCTFEKRSEDSIKIIFATSLGSSANEKRIYYVNINTGECLLCKLQISQVLYWPIKLIIHIRLYPPSPFLFTRQHHAAPKIYLPIRL